MEKLPTQKGKGVYGEGAEGGGVQMKWQLIAVSCLSLREKHTGRVGAHPDTGVIAPWLMGAGAFGIINFIYCVLSLSCFVRARACVRACVPHQPHRPTSLPPPTPLPLSSVVAFPRRDDTLLIAL